MAGEEEREELKEGEEEKQITMSEGAYEALLAQIADANKKSETLLKRLEKEDQAIAAAAQAEEEQTQAARRAGRFSDVKTAEELGERVVQIVREEVAQPIVQAVMTMAVEREVDKCRSKYSDFDEFAEDVYKHATANTKLSIEQAYLLAKSGKPPAKEKEGEKKEAPEKAKPAPKAFGGEKPSGSRGGMQVKSVMSVKESTRRAFDEVYKHVDV